MARSPSTKSFQQFLVGIFVLFVISCYYYVDAQGKPCWDQSDCAEEAGKECCCREKGKAADGECKANSDCDTSNNEKFCAEETACQMTDDCPLDNIDAGDCCCDAGWRCTKKSFCDERTQGSCSNRKCDYSQECPTDKGFCCCEGSCTSTAGCKSSCKYLECTTEQDCYEANLRGCCCTKAMEKGKCSNDLTCTEERACHDDNDLPCGLHCQSKPDNCCCLLTISLTSEVGYEYRTSCERKAQCESGLASKCIHWCRSTDDCAWYKDEIGDGNVCCYNENADYGTCKSKSECDEDKILCRRAGECTLANTCCCPDESIGLSICLRKDLCILCLPSVVRRDNSSLSSKF